MRLLPRWALVNPPSALYDLESVTPLQQTARVYGAMQEMIREYNNFADQINKEITEFVESGEAEVSNFKESVEERICCKFREMDAAFSKFRLEMKQYTDITLEKAFDIFGVTVEATGERIVLADAADEEIRGLSIYGKTTQAWDPVPDYPAALQSSGASGSITAVIMGGTGAKHQEITLATPDGLPGIRVPNGGNYTDAAGQEWICDEIDLKRGVYVQRINRMRLTGNETITGGSSWAVGCFAVYTKDKNPAHVHGEMMCSFLPMHSNADLASGKYEYGIGTHGEPNLMIRFGADKTEEQVRELWKKAIQDGGQVYTILQEPVERPLAAAELAAFKKLHTYYPDTTITNESGAGMKVEYVAITQLYMENRIQTLATEKAEQMIREAIAAGSLTVGVAYNEETEELNIIAQEV